MNVPSDLKYTPTHEWIRVDGDVATIGITEFAQSELGDIVYVDLPNVGRAVNAAEAIGSVESVKTVSDIYSPLGGEIVETNEALGARSELVNSDPYGDGWMFKVKVGDAAAFDGLLDADGYKGVLG
ncbi:MAG: glycine cleavage system protein GcvH [Fimbriimonadaceae bacterium]|nr:glycine cleavage system protein GcvH [Fimbriimonadaceae bacterium]